MIAAHDIGVNLKACFGANIANETHFGDWCELGSFLSSRKAVLPAMAALDRAMYDRLCNKRLATKVDAVDDRVMVTKAYHDYYGSYKGGLAKTPVLTAKAQVDKGVVSRLLGEVLSKFEKQKGFAFESGDYQTVDTLDDRTTPSNPKRHVATYHGFVQPKAFNGQLVKRSHWKDPGAQLIHGEFTHRLQWYAVTLSLFSEGDTAVKVFQSIGQYTGTYQRPVPGNGPARLYLWDALCDRTNAQDVSFDDALFATKDAPGRGNDFRSPENLNHFLKENEGYGEWLWPLLRDFLAARYSKRDFEVQQAMADAKKYFGKEEDWPVAFQLQYLCRKLYNVSVWSLPDSGPRYQKLLALAGDTSDQILKL